MRSEAAWARQARAPRTHMILQHSSLSVVPRKLSTICDSFIASECRKISCVIGWKAVGGKERCGGQRGADAGRGEPRRGEARAAASAQAATHCLCCSGLPESTAR